MPVKECTGHKQELEGGRGVVTEGGRRGDSEKREEARKKGERDVRAKGEIRDKNIKNG